MKYKDMKHTLEGKISYHLHHFSNSLIAIAVIKMFTLILFLLVRVHLISGYTWFALLIVFYAASITYHEIYKTEKKAKS